MTEGGVYLLSVRVYCCLTRASMLCCALPRYLFVVVVKFTHSVPCTHVQSVMELGATVCRPKQPDCAKCPVSSVCIAYAQQQVGTVTHSRGK